MVYFYPLQMKVYQIMAEEDLGLPPVAMLRLIGCLTGTGERWDIGPVGDAIGFTAGKP